MPKESRNTYQINALDLQELNFIFRLLADRFDELEGRRGTPSFKADVDMGSNRITTLGTGTLASDATRKDQTDADTTSLQGQITNHVTNILNPHSTTLEQARAAGSTISGTVQWLDPDGAVIHEFK